MDHLRGIIFDVDGTLVDSNDAHTQSWRAACAEEGLEYSAESIREKIGMGGDKLIPDLTGMKEDDPKARRISKRRGEIFKERYLPTLNAFRDVAALLERISREELRVGVASSAKQEELQPLLEIAGVTPFIYKKTSSDDAKQSKPAPDIVEAALKKLDLKPEEAIMIGDTPYDIDSAQKAGVKCLALCCGGWSREALSKADWVFESPSELLKLFDTSPLARA